MKALYRDAIGRLILVGLTSAIGDVAYATSWEFEGTNTLRSEYYESTGAPFSTPYTFEGDQHSSEFNLTFQNRVNPFDFWRGQVSGVLNASDYRSPLTGVVGEILSLVHQDGDGFVPNRLEVGDVYGYYSYRTMQASLKGLQWELQPSLETPGRSLSIMLTSGTSASSWRDIRPNDNFSNGVSVLLEDKDWGRFAVNVVQNHQDEDDFGTPERDHVIAGLSAEKTFRWGSYRWTAEGEWNWFEGDHAGTFFDPEAGLDRSDDGGMLQLSMVGSGALDARLRYEEYGASYRPALAFITPDRSVWDAQLGWRFDSGFRLRGRLQSYEDGRRTVDPIDLDIAGLNGSGRWLGITTVFDLSHQTQQNATGTIDNDVSTATLNLNRQVAENVTGSLSLYVQERTEHVASAEDVSTYQATASVAWNFSRRGWYGSLAPGVMYRSIRGGFSQTDDLQPTLTWSMSKGPHRLAASYAVLQQRPDTFGSFDRSTTTASASYSFTKDKNVFAVEANWYDQEVDQSAFAEASRFALVWTRHLGNSKPMQWLAPARQSASHAYTTAQKAPAPTLGSEFALSALTAFVSGTPVNEIVERAQQFGLQEQQYGESKVYEVSALPGLLQRQRWVAEVRYGAVQRAALLIEPDLFSSADSIAEQFERVREVFIRTFGNPSRRLGRGISEGGSVADRVNRGEFLDITEWEFTNGVLRLGIPQRLDGQVRFEAQFSAALPSANNTRWSIEEIN